MENHETPDLYSLLFSFLFLYLFFCLVLSAAKHIIRACRTLFSVFFKNGCVPASKDMEASVRAVEKKVGYQFKNKRLLEDALTHSSYTKSSSYQRLEFIGDSGLGCALSKYIFITYPHLDPGQLSLLRDVNISTEKFARVAIRHGLFQYVRHDAAALSEMVQKFENAIKGEENVVTYGGSVKPPKILADIVESVAAAIYVDCSFDLKALWAIFRGLLEPIATLEDLQKQRHPVTTLYEQYQKKGKEVKIQPLREGLNHIAAVYVDGKFVASSCNEQKETAKLIAAKEALQKLQQPRFLNSTCEINGAKQRLYELCSKKKWPNPSYRTEEEVGPAHDRKFICSVRIEASTSPYFMLSDMKSRVNDAENSAASNMLQEHGKY